MPPRRVIPKTGPGERLICRVCKTEIHPGAVHCPKCGRELGTPILPKPNRRGSAGNIMAGFASFIVPGLGQLLQGRVMAGIFHFCLAAVMWVFILGWIVHMASAFGAAMWSGPDR